MGDGGLSWAVHVDYHDKVVPWTLWPLRPYFTLATSLFLTFMILVSLHFIDPLLSFWKYMLDSHNFPLGHKHGKWILIWIHFYPMNPCPNIHSEQYWKYLLSLNRYLQWFWHRYCAWFVGQNIFLLHLVMYKLKNYEYSCMKFWLW